MSSISIIEDIRVVIVVWYFIFLFLKTNFLQKEKGLNFIDDINLMSIIYVSRHYIFIYISVILYIYPLIVHCITRIYSYI